ncbi:MAG: hypothetical protein LHV69_02765 [Elusimicrobia bacterium]|nr:hypothetical protein [Candidatus Obscuribacterium magneticum]
MTTIRIEFLGYQEVSGEPPIPLFNIRGRHGRRGSTVDANTLVREGIPLGKAKAPSWKDWRKGVRSCRNKT